MIDAYIAWLQVPAVFLRDVDELAVGGYRVGPVRKGEVARVPYILYQKLVRSGAVLLPEDYMVTYDDVTSRIWLEEKAHNELKAHGKDYFMRVRATVGFLLSRNDAESLRAGKLVLQRGRELANIRLRKIFSIMVLTPTALLSQEIVERLTYEEEVIVRAMSPRVKELVDSII